ncbi:MAG: hypothetical protein AUG74_13100 [Bacteroidetes bacterium 13_1_20CM_4_60_6]|nr:MAG: hypothetical protein AUG74_13100 [Bacteroidetes bacterium 13_1_20CM_4_60_6]
MIKLQVVIAEAARNRRATGKILIHKWTNYILLKTLLVIYHIVWNAEILGYAACIVNVLYGAAAPLHLLRHALTTSQTALVPELHGQSDNVIALRTQHGRDGGRIHTARHGYGNGLICRHKSH